MDARLLDSARNAIKKGLTLEAWASAYNLDGATLEEIRQGLNADVVGGGHAELEPDEEFTAFRRHLWERMVEGDGSVVKPLWEAIRFRLEREGGDDVQVQEEQVSLHPRDIMAMLPHDWLLWDKIPAEYHGGIRGDSIPSPGYVRLLFESIPQTWVDWGNVPEEYRHDGS